MKKKENTKPVQPAAPAAIPVSANALVKTLDFYKSAGFDFVDLLNAKGDRVYTFVLHDCIMLNTDVSMNTDATFADTDGYEHPYASIEFSNTRNAYFCRPRNPNSYGFAGSLTNMPANLCSGEQFISDLYDFIEKINDTLASLAVQHNAGYVKLTTDDLFQFLIGNIKRIAGVDLATSIASTKILFQSEDYTVFQKISLIEGKTEKAEACLINKMNEINTTENAAIRNDAIVMMRPWKSAMLLPSAEERV